jgi:hypothetical protein
MHSPMRALVARPRALNVAVTTSALRRLPPASCSRLLPSYGLTSRNTPVRTFAVSTRSAGTRGNQLNTRGNLAPSTDAETGPPASDVTMKGLPGRH